MKDWKASRNYRRIRDKNGNVISNIITVDGIDVEVTEEVFKAYSTMERKERYQDEAKADAGFLSLEQMAESELMLEYVCSDLHESCEDIVITQFERIQKERLLVALRYAMERLTQNERELIEAVFVQKTSMRDIAKEKGVYHRAIQYQTEKTLKKLKKFLKNC